MLLELDNCVLKEDLGVILKRDKRLVETVTSRKGDYSYTFPVRTRKHYNSGKTRIISVQSIRSMVDYDKSLAVKMILWKLDEAGIDYITELPVLCGPEWKSLVKRVKLPRKEEERSLFCIDIYLPEYNTILEYDSQSFHSGRSARILDSTRDKYLKIRFPDINIIRIPEAGSKRYERKLDEIISGLVPSDTRIDGNEDVMRSMIDCYGQSLKKLNDNCKLGCYLASSKGLGVDKILLSALDDYEKNFLPEDRLFFRLTCFLGNIRN